MPVVPRLNESPAPSITRVELIRHLIRLNDQLPQPHQLILYFRDAPQPATFPPSAHVIQRVIPLHRLLDAFGVRVWVAP
jgi:hypothetical protein